MLQMYKGFYISGTAGMVHPFSPESYPAGKIYKPGPAGSIEEVTRFSLHVQDDGSGFSRVLRVGTG
jgi:hypothetical protein